MIFHFLLAYLFFLSFLVMSDGLNLLSTTIFVNLITAETKVVGAIFAAKNWALATELARVSLLVALTLFASGRLQFNLYIAGAVHCIWLTIIGILGILGDITLENRRSGD